MACCLVGTKPLSEPMLEYCWLDLYEQTSVNFNWNSHIFIQENTFENVIWEMSVILSQPQRVKFVQNKGNSAAQAMKLHHLSTGWGHLDGLVQERCNSSVLAMEFHLSCTNPSIWNIPNSQKWSKAVFENWCLGKCSDITDAGISANTYNWKETNQL